MKRAGLPRAIFVILMAVFFMSDASAAQKTKAVYGIPSGPGMFKNKTPREIAQYLKESGVNAVIDVPLDDSIIGELHGNGIKAYAQLPMFCGKEHWLEHPESRPVTADGNLIEEYGWYAGVCASQEWLITQKINAAQELAKKYPIDGLWLDFMRWPTRWDVKEPKILDTCFCASCLKRFQKETGIRIPGSLKSTKEISDWVYKNYSRRWYAWRSDVIADTVCRVSKAIKKYRKDAVVGIFLVPWGNDDYDNAIYKVIGQDLAKLSQCADVFSPMSYNLICGRDNEWIISLNRQVSSRVNRAVWPIVQATDEPRQMSVQEYAEVLEAGLSGGSSGIVVFNTEAALESGKWQAQKGIFTHKE